MSEAQQYNLAKFDEDENYVFELRTHSNAIVPISLRGLVSMVSVPDGQRGPTRGELKKFGCTILGQGADPNANECGLMPVFTGGFHYEVWVAAQVRMRKVQAQPDYQGYSWGWITADMTRHEPGRKSRANPDEIVGAWGEVYREGREPYYHEVFLKEFVKPSKSGKGKWEVSPMTMLSKVISDQTHKKSFADKMGNLNTFEELTAYNEKPTLEKPDCNTAPRSERRKPVASHEVTPIAEEPEVLPPDMDAGMDADGGDTIDEPQPEPPAEDPRLVEIALKGVYNQFCQFMGLDGKDAGSGEAFRCIAKKALQCSDEDVSESKKFTMPMVTKVKAFVDRQMAGQGGE